MYWTYLRLVRAILLFWNLSWNPRQPYIEIFVSIRALRPTYLHALIENHLEAHRLFRSIPASLASIDFQRCETEDRRCCKQAVMIRRVTWKPQLSLSIIHNP